MPRTITTLRYALIAVVAIIVVALFSWYLFLRAKGNALTESDARRGAGSVQPSGGLVGSTYENIVSSLGTRITGESEATQGEERITQASKTPAAGIGFVTSGTTTVIRFVERSTGYVLEKKSGRSSLERLTNTLLPQAFETIVMRNGRVIVRSLENDTIVTTVGTIASTSAGGARMLIQKALPSGIRAIVASPNGEEIFYIVETSEGAAGIRAAWDGSKPKQMFSSAAVGWRLRWLSDGRIVLVQNAADGVAGYAFVLAKDGTVTLLLRNIPGLTVLPKESSAAVLYGESGGDLALYAQIDEKTTPTLLPIRTIAEKCIWAPSSAKATDGKFPALVAYCAVPQVSPGANFLDRWYRGEAHTADAWWRVDARANSAELLYAPGNIEFDVENPVIDPKGNYIAFINAVDKSPWLLRISER